MYNYVIFTYYVYILVPRGILLYDLYFIIIIGIYSILSMYYTIFKAHVHTFNKKKIIIIDIDKLYDFFNLYPIDYFINLNTLL